MLQFRLARPRGATGREVWNRVSLSLWERGPTQMA
jgi:hypothetical protein